MREVLRREEKYLITYEEYRRIDGLLEQVLHPDPHNGSQGYSVRSLYFDSLENRDYCEKQDGIELRRKIRLRIYSPKDTTALLEIKQKEGANQKKRSLSLERQMAERLCDGDYGVLLKEKTPMAAEIYGILQMYCYKPKAVIEYKRKAYIKEENAIRITFDSDIVGTESCFQIFSPELSLYPLFDPFLVVMEVKYNGFMLSYIKDLLNLAGKTPTSVSKYCLGRKIGMNDVFL